MSRMHLWALLLLGLPFAAAAAEPETLPPPRSMTPAVPPPVMRMPAVVIMGHPRVSDYEHWQYYGVTRSGRFRPLVVTMPDGMSYYRYNGAPYPYTMVHPEWVMPYASD
jgi:hypothetical protein